MTSLERVLKTMGQKEPDRLPAFLMLTMHGAKELGLSPRDYFSKAEHIIEGQLRLGQKYQNDCVCTSFGSASEFEAFGGAVSWADDGEPNPAQPLIGDAAQIGQLAVPDVRTSKALRKVFKATEGLNREVGNKIPIIGTVMSPFSLPVMQLGLDKYLELMHSAPGLFDRLIEINREFCVNYANMQLEAGATAICYSDLVPPAAFMPWESCFKTRLLIAQQTIPLIKGPVILNFDSGRMTELVDHIEKTGAAIIRAGAHEDIERIKFDCKHRITLLGNMDSAEMRNWGRIKTVDTVKDIIRKAAPGGGFILGDDQGEIPWQVSEETLMNISETVQEFGQYPIMISD